MTGLSRPNCAPSNRPRIVPRAPHQLQAPHRLRAGQQVQRAVLHRPAVPAVADLGADETRDGLVFLLTQLGHKPQADGSVAGISFGVTRHRVLQITKERRPS
jgi:hypothetical protein